MNLQTILASNDLTVAEVDVPEWGGVVHVRTLTGTARDKIDAKFTGHNNDPRKLAGMRAYVVGNSLCDADGTPWRVSDTDLKALSEKSGAALDRVYAKCSELSRLGGDVEGEAKN